MDSLRVLHSFRLDDLNEGWVKSVWDAEFVVYGEPPDDCLGYLESDDVRLLLRESRLALREWIAANECEHKSSEFSWQALMLLNINIRGLLAMLGYIMKTGQRAKTDHASRQACLEATSLYLMFLTIPGSNVFRVYHPNLYQRAVSTLKMSENLFPATERNNADTADSGMDDELSDDCHLLHSERVRLTEDLSRIISDLIVMLKSFRLKEHIESLDVTVRALLDITRLDVHVKFNNSHGITLSQKAFAALRELCSSNHGTVTLTIMLIVQYMLPDMLFHHTYAQPKSATIFHEAAIYFLKSLLNVHESETVQVIVTLVHHLMVKCPERLEGRQRQAVVIIKLLRICSEDVVVKVLKDIVLFSYSTRISYRLFAQEIIGKLLTEALLSGGDLNEHIKMKLRRILVAVVLSRCTDRSPLVRGKAMATLTAVSDCSDNDDESILRGVFETSTPDKAFLTLDELKRAFAEDVDPLPGSNTLVLIFLDRVNDERALVRRSALKIFRNLSVMFPSLVGRVTRVISDRCRDPTLTVRQFAVHVLSEILERFPHNLSLLGAWVRAVVPQIYDIEARVQEKVLECLESVLIRRITSVALYTPDAASSRLPWRVLDALSKMRMTKHLSKACGLWIKNSVITESVISNLQSHIGADNTIGAWILLAALAENMRIPNINKYVADYKEVIQKNDFHASLMLQVLRHTWSTLDRDLLKDLQQHFYERISQFKIKSNLISICLDILTGVLRHLHADGDSIESSMTELLELSEAEIRDLTLEEHGSQDVLVKSRAVLTLGHASLLCTRRISSSTLRALAQLLLDWDSLPEALREMKELQASAVVLLCQQALRDRDVAKHVTLVLSTLISRETDSSSPTKIAIKINAAKALADICVRFTALVEPYLTDMCISMKDSSPAVREAIVVIFIQLLLEDFIKLKGRFFFHILTMLSDTDRMIRELTVFLVEERLLAKNKTLISQQFLGSIYHYNDYRSRNAFCVGHKMRDQEKKLLTLPGSGNQEKRNVIYEFMLEHLDASARYELIAKLTRHVLREVCDGTSIDVTIEEGACVLRDTVFIMSNTRMQPSSFGERHRDDAAELDETVGAAPSSTATGNNGANVAVTAIKRHNLDTLLPTLITLKKKLAALKSSLEDDVESLLFKTYSEYEREQLFTLLSEYPELEKEMDSYQRRLKDKTIPENDNRASTSPVTNYRELLLSMSQKSPQVRLRRLSLNSGQCLRIAAPPDTVVADDSAHLETVLETPPPEPGLGASTPLLTRGPQCGDSAKRLSGKRSPGNHAISSNSPQRKVLKSSAN